MVDVFVDTSAWYALRVANDPNHPRARRIHQRLIQERAWLHTSDWVLVETMALMANRIGGVEAVGTGDWIRSSAAVRLHPMGDAGDEAWSLFQEAQGRVSLVDCGCFAMMSRLELKRVFAFDTDFESRGFHCETTS